MKNKEYFWKQLNHVPEGVRYTVGLILFCILGTNISYLIFKVLERIFLR